MNYLIAIFSGTGFAIISAWGYLFYKTGKYQNIVDEMKITLNNHSNKFNLINDKFDKLFDTINNKIERIAVKVSALEAGIERDRIYNGLIQKKSPFTITELGYKALTESGALKFIDNNKSILVSQVEAKNPKSSYDVQEFSKEVLSKYTNSDEFIDIKEYIYEKGIDLESILMTMTVYLRDIILVKRKGNK